MDAVQHIIQEVRAMKNFENKTTQGCCSAGIEVRDRMVWFGTDVNEYR
jgi:hypothetical protein